MKKFGESAIHDEGFQFFMIVHVEHQLEKLIREIKALQNCLSAHKDMKKESWYSSKTTVPCYESFEEYKDYYPDLTLAQCKESLYIRQQKYSLLIELSEKALQSAIEQAQSGHSPERYQPFYKDLERNNVIVEETAI